MPACPLPPVMGAVFVGGKSSRFEDGDKAAAVLGTMPLVEHVINRLSTQVQHIVLSGNFTQQSLNLPPIYDQVPDIISGQKGPLIATLSCLEYLTKTECEWLLTSACDTPFLPTDMADALLREATQKNTGICVPHDGERLQPANALWHRDLYQPLKEAVEQEGMQGFHQFLDTQSYASVTWPLTSDHFININTQLDLAEAERILNRRPT